MIGRIGIVGICLWLLGASLPAQNTAVRELEAKRKAALAAIEETSRLLTSTKQSAKSGLNRLQLLTAEIRSRQEVIDLMNQEIRQIDRQQQQMGREVDRLAKELREKKDRYGQAMRGFYARRSQYNKLMFILSASTIEQSYRRMRYLREYAAWRKIEAEEIVDRQQELDAKRKALEQTRSEKQALLAIRTQESEKLGRQEQEQQSMVTELRKKERSLQTELTRKRKQAADLDRQIEKLIAEEMKKAAAAASKKEERKSATKDGYKMTKEDQALSGTFEKNRGKLPFPISGSYLVVSRFGEQQHQQLKYVRINNNGIDIQTKPGTQARAVFDGVVAKVFMSDNLINLLIRHGNYWTVYSNLSDVQVKAGDKVTTRQTLGTVYSDPEDDNRTVLHFEIRKDRDKFNPEAWLSR